MQKMYLNCCPKLEEEKEKYDVVILDPPAFTKVHAVPSKNAVKGYREINLRATEAGEGRRFSGHLLLFPFYGI